MERDARSDDGAASEGDFDYDVAIVGGGPAGCSAGVFTARYGLDTVIFDRGKSSILRCAYVENYLGFPAGIDIDTLYELMHDHATEAGCEVVADLVESVEHADATDGFVVQTQEGRRVTTRRVVAATRYGGDYLRPLGGDAMFETSEYSDGEREHFDRSYPAMDGTTPVDGLFVASPAAETDQQAIVAAGRGGRVGLRVVKAVRRVRGFPEPVASHYDWLRDGAKGGGPRPGRDKWRDYFERKLPDDHGLTDERRIELREREVDRRLSTYLSDEAIEARTERGQERLLEHVDDDRVLERAREIRAGRNSADSN